MSLIIATLNRKHMLSEALDSIDRQDVEAEVIVIDGGSSDGTIEMLVSRSVDYVSEPDGGVYDAWNKGVARASGDIIGFLNSDDRLADGALAAVLAGFSPDIDSVCGAATVGPRLYESRDLSYPLIAFGPVITNARFFRSGLFELLGAFDPRLRIVGDREWLFRAWRAGISTKLLSEVVYHYRQHEGSLTMNSSGGGGETAVIETIKVCQGLMTDPDPEVSSLGRRWLAWKVGYAVHGAMRSRRWGDAARWLNVGFRTDSTWPVRFRRTPV